MDQIKTGNAKSLKETLSEDSLAQMIPVEVVTKEYPLLDILINIDEIETQIDSLQAQLNYWKQLQAKAK